MQSLILAATSRILLPLLLLFSLFLLIRGHYEPGGGFIGGLVAAAGFALYSIASGVGNAREALRIHPKTLIGVGLLFAVTAGMFAVVVGEPFMTALWIEQSVPILGKVGTPLLFDVGVYLVVVGVALSIIFNLAEE